MKYYKMLWGDVVRMVGDFAFPAGTFEHIEFAPSKEDYKENGNPAMLRKAVIASFIASSKKFSVRKWVIDEVGILPHLASFKQNKSRWNIDFIKEEDVVIEEEEIVEEIQEEEETILEKEKE